MLMHTNINNLQKHEWGTLFNHLFSLNENMDFIFLFHDEAMVRRQNALDKIVWEQ
jgi:hypothetical protein